MGQKLGQHFLKDGKVLAAIAREMLSDAPHTAIEIGPGHGELTDALLAAGAKHITAIEKDAALVAKLRRKYGDGGVVEVIEGDVRKILPSFIKNSGSVIGGNIPYYLTGFLLRLLGDLIISNHSLLINRVVLLVQKEVAYRAAADAPAMNLLSAMVRGWAKPKVVFSVSRKVFSPPPKVDSALLVLEPLSRSKLVQSPNYFKITKLLFAHPRKTLANNLFGGIPCTRAEVEAAIHSLGLSKNARAAELEASHIKALAKMMYN